MLRKQIVIVGGGFAGIAAARGLKRVDADVTIIDRRNHHIFQPLLYQVATAVLAPSEIAAPIRQLAREQKNVSVLLADVTGVDLESRTIEAVSPKAGMLKIPFDYLVIATGVQPSYFGHDEFAKYAPSLKTLGDAEDIRAKILGAYELAETTNDEAVRARQMTFVLVGGGPTGVELAASIAQLATTTLRGQYRHIDPADSSIILIESGKRILPTFSDRLAAKAAKRLEKLGVRILTGVRVEIVDATGVVANSNRIPAATVLWTAGVAAPPLLKLLGAESDRAGRVVVDPYLNVKQASGVFVIGDASMTVSDGRPVPGVAQAAIQEGRYVASAIARYMKGRAPKGPFRYADRGSMAVVGKNFAILETRHVRVAGFFTWLVWATVHLMALPQLQNRLRVQRQWLWSYFTGQRSSELIPEQPARSREASATALRAKRSKPQQGRPAETKSPAR
ncbi:NAD(P)/FAD-dependent oxidoreductase [Bradyrhizobium mercantei]|uniref:NAD(P)/FAD-dependent oxidoreductase n=1 Tax=Bradyrhizobium mercantei TaxID=1904807 RepID=UPI000975A9AE|nr:NAD(P)/FAD-dependent oxidoreductase [Bradyrhizobium mercantei]